MKNTRAVILSAVLGVIWYPPCADTVSLGHCGRALGMESGEIVDDQILVSSSHNENSVGAQSARIRTELKGGAWCPSPVITDHVHEYVQIDLGQVTVITAAETQGRFGNGQGVEWAEQYLLQYWRDSAAGGTGWKTYKNLTGDTLMDGNTNTYLARKVQLNPPIIASRVRFVPRSQHPRTVCMRVEVYGCPFRDAVDSYSMEPPDLSRPDLTYDGLMASDIMEAGLGQLLDGHIASDDVKDAQWVGWKRKKGDVVTVTFQFSDLRELESVVFHTSNHFTTGVKLFARADLYFSLDGEEYTTTPIPLEPEPDRIFENARSVDLRLYRQVAQFVRIDFVVDDQWLMLSEITFESSPSMANITRLTIAGAETAAVPADPEAEDPENSGSQAPLAVILGVLGLVLLLLSGLVGYVVRAGRRRKVAGGSSNPTPLQLPLTLNMKDLPMNSGYARTAGGDLYRPGAGSEEEKVNLCTEPYRVVRLNSDYSSGQLTDDKLWSSDTTYDYAVPVENKTPPPPFTDCVPSLKSWDNPNYKESSTNTTSSSSHPSVCNITDFLPSPPPIPPPPHPESSSSSSSTSVSRRHRVLAASVEGVAGNCVWQASGRLAKAGPCLRTIDGNFVHLRDKIGEGRFGEIHACEIHFPSTPDSQYQTPSRLATARILRTSAPPDAAERLRLESDPLGRVSDPHVTRLIGTCTLDDTHCLLVEYMENGDLSQFLRKLQHDPANRQRTVKYGSLIYMATQIAAGMKHLESLGIVHRDLATRNCLVGHNLKVKVGDLGPSRVQYASDYVTLSDGRVIPLRWRAPEAVFTEEMTTSSDVWSFSVTLWEVLTGCRLQPMAHLSDSEVTDRLACYRDTGSDPYLPQPNGCPREVYDLMAECWRRDTEARPSFSEIHMFLQRKNLGFEPTHD